MLSKASVSAIERHFEAVWVLSLKRSVERRALLRKQLAPLNYAIYWGEDARALSQDTLQKQGIYDPEKAKKAVTPRMGYQLTPQEIACAWSHRNIYEDMLKRDLDSVLVLEDDVWPCEAGLRVLDRALGDLPTDWELCYLGYYGNEHYDFGSRLKQAWYRVSQPLGLTRKAAHQVGKSRYLQPYTQYLCHAGFHFGSHAYAITQKACRRLIQHQTPICFPADRTFGHLLAHRQLKGFAVRFKAFTNATVEGGMASLLGPEKEEKEVC